MPAEFDISPVLTPPPAVSPPPVVRLTPPPVQHAAPVPKQSSTKLLKWLILVASGLIVVTVSALWFGPSNFATEDIGLTLEAPQVTGSGDQLTYKVSVRNGSRVALHDLSFRLFYPDGTLALVDGAPQARESEGFTIDEIAPGETATKELGAILVGDRGSPKQARVNLIFQAGSLKTSFQKETAATTYIGELPVRITLSGPPSAVAGQAISYLIDVRNNLEETQRDLRVNLELPDGFTVETADPKSTRDTSWDLDALDPDEGKRITITGALSGSEREVKTVRVVVQRLLNGQYVDVAREETSTMISSPLLSVVIAPSEGRDYVAFPGDTLRYIVTYENNSRFTFSGLLLGVKLEGDMYDTSRIQVEGGFYDEAQRMIVYDSAGEPDFAALQPGRSGRLTFTVPLKPGFEGRLEGAGTSFVRATARLVTPNVPVGVDQSEVAAQDVVTTRIGSQPSLSHAVLYDDGAGSGPIPPTVGSETVMTVRWQVTNPGNDIKNAVVTATLAPGVTFKDEASTAQGTAPVYDRASSRVTWSIGTLPYGTGNGTARYEATFKVAITPGSNQVGNPVALVSAASLTGTDAFTSLPVQSQLGTLTTASIDGHSTLEGRVVSP
jgi:hypothetical protein